MRRATVARLERGALAAVLLLGMAGTAKGQWGGGGLGGIFGSGDAGGTPPSRIAFRPWVSANGTYSQPLGVRDVPGTRRDYYGYGGSAGVSGARGWERTSVAGFYTVNYQRWTGMGVRGGASQVGGFTVSHKATERVGLFVTQFAGTSLGGFGYGAPAGIFGGFGIAGSALLPSAGLFGAPMTDLANNGLVDNEFYSSRVHFYGTSGGVTFRPSLKWSFGAGAQANFVRRKGPGLRDLNSAGVFGRVGYQPGQNTQVGFFYGYSEFSYPKLFGGNRAQFAGIGLTHSLSPQTQLSLSGGLYRMDTQFLGAVETDPVIAELLGVSSQLEVQKRSFSGWQGSASIHRSWREWGVSLGYTHGLNPGNGAILASRRDSVYGSAGRGFRRVSFGTFGGFYRWSGLLQNTALTSGSVGASLGFRVAGDLFVGCNGGYSYFETASSARRWQRFVSVHLTWSPSAAAFRF
ncbi:MAG: hypothetical protein ACUVS7_03450 [Bryobacteraceae bacterium]